MTLRQRSAGRPPGYPQSGSLRARKSSTDGPKTAALARAFDHEHGRLYEALEMTAQLAELAGHEQHAAELRRMRRAVMEDIHYRSCS